MKFGGVIADTCQITNVFGKSLRLGDDIDEHKTGEPYWCLLNQSLLNGFLITKLGALIDSFEGAFFSKDSRIVNMVIFCAYESGIPLLIEKELFCFTGSEYREWISAKARSLNSDFCNIESLCCDFKYLIETYANYAW